MAPQEQRKPRIGISAERGQRPDGPALMVDWSYLDSVSRAGGLPLILPFAEADVEACLDQVDGLLLTGGNDVDPKSYGEVRLPETGPCDLERDANDFALFRSARERGLPILAICRGFQLINIALGGKLWQDLPTQRPGLDHSPDVSMETLAHVVTLTPQAVRLRAAFGRDIVEVNSIHHQGIRSLGSGLRAAATAPDGLIEAFEADEPHLVGVQFHPETLTGLYRDFQALFQGFVDAARQFSRSMVNTEGLFSSSS